MDLKDVKEMLELFNLSEDKMSQVGIQADEITLFLRDLKEKLHIHSLTEYIRSFKFRTVPETPKPNYMLNYKPALEILGHVSAISRVLILDDYLFTASDDGKIKLWEIHTGLLIHTFLEHHACINDICVSSDKCVMCSVDAFGVLNIFSLSDLKLLFAIHIGDEVDFIEFCQENEESTNIADMLDEGLSLTTPIGKQGRGQCTYANCVAHERGADTERTRALKKYSLSVVEHKGTIKVIQFTSENILNEKENKTMNEIAVEGSIEAICISEGRRFLICGGLWPFLLVFDLALIKNILVFETEGYSIAFVTASRSNVKFAASTNFEMIFCWEFISNTLYKAANHKKKKCCKTSGWRKSVIDLKTEDCHCTQMGFLCDDRYLVCLCSDRKMRIYFNTSLVKVFDHNLRMVCCHPTLNAFLICSDQMEIFDVAGNVVLSEPMTFNILDCQFSQNGQFIVLSDEMGNFKIFNLFPFFKKLKEVPREQFFLTELQNESGQAACDRSCTVSFNKVVNKNWELRPFKVTEGGSERDRNIVVLEQLAFFFLQDELMDFKMFKKKYFELEQDIDGNVSDLSTTLDDLNSTSSDESDMSFKSTKNSSLLGSSEEEGSGSEVSSTGYIIRGNNTHGEEPCKRRKIRNSSLSNISKGEDFLNGEELPLPAVKSASKKTKTKKKVETPPLRSKRAESISKKINKSIESENWECSSESESEISFEGAESSEEDSFGSFSSVSVSESTESAEENYKEDVWSDDGDTAEELRFKSTRSESVRNKIKGIAMPIGDLSFKSFVKQEIPQDETGYENETEDENEIKHSGGALGIYKEREIPKEKIIRKQKSSVTLKNPNSTELRTVVKIRQTAREVDIIQLSSAINNWLVTVNDYNYFPQIGDEVFFSYEKYLSFRERVDMDVFECNYPLESCNLIINNINFLLDSPTYVQLDMKCLEDENSYQVKYFLSGEIFTLTSRLEMIENLEIGEDYKYIRNNCEMRGRLVGIENENLTLENKEGERVFISKADLYFENSFELPQKKKIDEIFDFFKSNKALYSTVRRDSNVRYSQNVAYPINFNVIWQRVKSNFYRRSKALQMDLEWMRKISNYLQKGYGECVKRILNEIYHCLDIEPTKRLSRRRSSISYDLAQ